MSRAAFRKGTAEERERKKQRIVELHRDGCSTAAIAERLGVGVSSVNKVLSDHGLKGHLWSGGVPA